MLERFDVDHDVKEYPGAGHAFIHTERNGPPLLQPLMERAGAGPHPAAAEDAWGRLERFLAKHLT